MAKFDLYVDTVSGELVTGPNNLRPGLLPRLTQGDTVTLNIYLLARTTDYPNGVPLQIINNANLSLRVAIGPRDGTAGSTLDTQQFTWSKDSQNQYFYADFPMNTAAIATLIGAKDSDSSHWFEIEVGASGGYTTVYSQQVKVYAEVIETTPLVTPPGATAVTLEFVKATCLQNTNSGFVIVNPNTGAKVQVYVGDDGAFHADPIP